MNFLGLGERADTGGAVLSAPGCAACFPLMASLAGYLGLRFLAAYESLFINTPSSPGKTCVAGNHRGTATTELNAA